MASFDVTNLFTNLPLEETLNYSLSKTSDIVRLFDETRFRKLLDTTTKDILFHINQRLLEEIGRVAVVSL